MKIGYIGLGSLGAPIARRIARSGYDLAVYDISPDALAAFDEPGATRLPTPIEVARHAEILCVCVRMDADLTALAADGTLFDALGVGNSFVIHSTVDPTLCKTLAETAKTRGVDVVDAGVSGGGPAALRGELSLFVGGTPQAVARAKPLFDCIAKSVAHLGPVGRGMQGKLLNNLVSIANYGMSAAILDLGESLDFDRNTLRDALMAGSAEGFALRAVPGLLRPESADALRQLLGKDLDHARSLAPATDPAMAALVSAAQSLLDRLASAAGSR